MIQIYGTIRFNRKNQKRPSWTVLYTFQRNEINYTDKKYNTRMTIITKYIRICFTVENGNGTVNKQIYNQYFF